jgi:hypothetical protein
VQRLLPAKLPELSTNHGANSCFARSFSNVITTSMALDFKEKKKIP